MKGHPTQCSNRCAHRLCRTNSCSSNDTLMSRRNAASMGYYSLTPPAPPLSKYSDGDISIAVTSARNAKAVRGMERRFSLARKAGVDDDRSFLMLVPSQLRVQVTLKIPSKRWVSQAKVCLGLKPLNNHTRVSHHPGFSLFHANVHTLLLQTDESAVGQR